MNTVTDPAARSATVSRKQFQDIIARALAVCDAPPDAQEALKVVGATAKRIGVGSYDGGPVHCPVARAFPKRWAGLTWDAAFVNCYDARMRALVGDECETVTIR